MDSKFRRITALLEAALIEDKATQNVTTALTIDPNLRATGTIVAKQSCVVAGIGCISAFLSLYGKLSTNPVGRFEVVRHPEIFDGVHIKKGQAIAVIRANAASILSTERVILNLMQRMSGIATLTNEYVAEAAKAKSPSRIQTRSSTRARPSPACARWISTPSVAAAAPTTGSICRTETSSRTTASRSAAGSCGAGARPRRTQARTDRPGRGPHARRTRPGNRRRSQVHAAGQYQPQRGEEGREARSARDLPKCHHRGLRQRGLKTVRDYAKTGVNFIFVGAPPAPPLPST